MKRRHCTELGPTFPLCPHYNYRGSPSAPQLFCKTEWAGRLCQPVFCHMAGVTETELLLLHLLILSVDLNADLDADLNTDLNADLDEDLDADLNTDLDADLNEDLDAGLPGMTYSSLI